MIADFGDRLRWAERHRLCNYGMVIKTEPKASRLGANLIGCHVEGKLENSVNWAASHPHDLGIHIHSILHKITHIPIQHQFVSPANPGSGDDINCNGFPYRCAVAVETQTNYPALPEYRIHLHF